MNPQSASRVTDTDYLPTIDLAMPLPAVGGLVCRYEPSLGGALPRLVESFPVSRDDAEQIRAAYLAHRWPTRRCVDEGSGPLFAAVLVDATGSWLSLGFDTGACNLLAGPEYVYGSAGHWLVERVRYASP
jgi:hypothetical protein